MWSEYYNALKTLYENVQSELSDQDSNISSYYSATENVASSLQSAEDSLFNAWQYEWEIKVDKTEAEKSIKELGQSLTEALTADVSISSKVRNTINAAETSISTGSTYRDKADSTIDRIYEEIAKGDYSSLAKTVEDAESTKSDLESQYSDTVSQISSLLSLIPDIIGEAYDVFSEWKESLEQSNNIISAMSNIFSNFSNGTYSNGANKYLEQQDANNRAILQVSTSMFEDYYDKLYTEKDENDKTLTQRRDEAEKALKAATENKDTSDEELAALNQTYTILNSEVEAYEEDMNSSLEDMVSEITSLAENAFTEMTNTISDIVENSFEQIFGETLAASQTAYNWLQTTSKRYLDETETPYKISNFSSYANKLISDTDNLSYQQRLTAVYNEQLKILQEKEKLSQYDVDRAQKLLDLEIKRQALEDARNNKTNLKLRRDQSGNYSYQYVADASKIADAESAYETAKNDVYELDKTNLASATSTFYSDMQAMQDELKTVYQELYNSDGTYKEGVTQDTVNAAVQKIKDKYQSVMVSGSQDVLSAYNNLKSSSGLNWDSMSATEKESALRAAGIDPSIISSIENNLSTSSDWSNWFDSNFGPSSEYQNTIVSTVDTLTGLYNTLDSLNQKMSVVTDDANTEEKTISELIASADKNLGDTILEMQNLEGDLEDTKTAIENLQKAINTANNTDDSSTSYTTTTSAALTSALTPTVTEGATTASTVTTPTTSSSTKTTYFSETTHKVGDQVTIGSTTYLYKSANGGIDSDLTTKSGNAGLRDGKHKWEIKTIKKSGSHPYEVQSVKNSKYKGWVSLKTGGYTGDWSDQTPESENGKLAWLHQKEMVLNADDTSNMLSAVGLVRDVASLLDSLDNSALSAFVGTLNSLGQVQNVSSSTTDNSIDQNITINAEFPNATNSEQIERAFKNLSNIALQKASNKTTIKTAVTTL
jgi:hypothetical protein